MDRLGDKGPYAMGVQRLYITNKVKCARLLNSPIYTCKGSQDSVNANRISWSDEEYVQADLCFSVRYFFLRCRSQILTAKPQPRSQCQSHSSQC